MPHRRRSTKLVDRIIAASIDRPFSPPVSYLIATASVMGMAVLRAALITELLPWLMYVPVVLACALALGARPAILSLLLSAGCAAWTIYIPGEPFFLTAPQWGATLVFLAVGGLVITVGQQLREALVRADALAGDYVKALELAEARGDILAEREAFLSGILASSSDCIKVLDLEGRLQFMSDGGQQVMEVTDFGQIAGCPWESFWDGEGNVAVRESVAAAGRGQPSSFTGEAPTMAGNMRWWDVAVSPILDATGRPERILSVSRDITSSKTADDQVRLLNAELGHRLKNTLALVQAIVAQTLKGDVDVKQARDALIDRLIALGRGADILTASSWDAADVGALARSVLAPHTEGGRIGISGPRVLLASRLGLSLSLALHELATNAVKYGALSNDDGKVELSWKIMKGAGPNGDRLRLTWTETNGPPVTEPGRKGFGSVLTGRALSENFKGQSTVEYNPNGIVFALDAPVAALNELVQG